VAEPIISPFGSLDAIARFRARVEVSGHTV
jgi:hypothetical protein